MHRLAQLLRIQRGEAVKRALAYRCIGQLLTVEIGAAVELTDWHSWWAYNFAQFMSVQFCAFYERKDRHSFRAHRLPQLVNAQMGVAVKRILMAILLSLGWQLSGDLFMLS
jgi:hypothetical protein